MWTLSASTLEDGNADVRVSKFPDSCPICHYGIEARFRKLSHLVPGHYRASLELVFQCPRIKCQRFFISRYQLSTLPGTSHYDYEGSVPFEPFAHDFSENIQSISPMFCTIANEAENAEHQGWKL